MSKSRRTSRPKHILSGPRLRCPLVVLGASAGGLESFQKFFQNMPKEVGMSFLLVQHLDPKHDTLIPELLSKHTTLRVVRLVDGQKLLPDHVFVAPQSTNVLLQKNCVFRLRPSTSNDKKPIDQVFSAVAQAQSENIVGVVLTGTGDDGTLGLQAIKRNGGLTIAQHPDSAKYDGMPRSAVATGAVDLVLPVDEMPLRIVEYFRHREKVHQRKGSESIQEEALLNLQAIFELLRTKTGHDFSRYKQSTVVRRIQRRMQLLYLDSVAKYVELLGQDGAEVESLFKDLLIGVTQFFRDPESFEALSQSIIPELFRGKTEKDVVRVWVPGCATGEEAYTLAILLTEHAAKLKEKRPAIQVFATDLDGDALEVARKARYGTDVVQQVSPERLGRYFKKIGRCYEVQNSIRELCIFSPHNLIKDPPFSRLDLLSCRNVLIYLEADLQKKLLPLFHYALNPCGLLFLGPSENIPSRSDLFRAVDLKHRIFQRKPSVLHAPLHPPVLEKGQVTKFQAQFAGAAQPKEQTLARTIERVILEDYAPASAVINAQGDVLYFSGNTAKYLQPPTGAPTNKLVAMAHKSLRLELRTAVHRAITTRKETVRENLKVNIGKEAQVVELLVRPLSEAGKDPDLFIVVFRELIPSKSEARQPAEDFSTEEHPVIKQLEYELRSTKEDLQTTIEELETSNEELKSANEELLSMNEELQSANEELQTSKEEVQSANEELSRKIEEAETAAAELRLAHEDRARLAAIVQYSEDAIIGKTLDGIVTSWNPGAERVFGYSAAEMIGNSILKVIPPERHSEESYILGRLRRGERVDHYETERLRKDGTRIVVSLTSSPVRDPHGVIIGAAKIARDITEKRIAEEAQLRLAAIVESTDDAIITRTLDGVITSWNKAAERIFGYPAAEASGKNISILFPPDRLEEETKVIAQIRRGERVDHFETIRKSKDGRLIDVSLTVSPLRDAEGRIIGASKIARDISGRKQAEEARLRLAAVVESSDDAIVSKTLDGIIMTWNNGAERIFGYSAEEIIGKHITTLFPPDRLDEETKVIGHIRRGERIEHFETIRKTRDGRLIDISLTVSPIKDPLGRIIGASKIARDITTQKRTEAAFRHTAERLQLAMAAGGLGDWSWDSTSDIVTLSLRAAEIFDFPPGERITWTCMREILHEEDRERARIAVERALLQRSQYNIEYRIRRRSGRITWIAARGLGVYGDDGSSPGMIGVVQDITERKRTEEELREERRALELLHETGSGIAAELNLEKLVQQVTDAATKLSGAKFGAFFYNVLNTQGESFVLYTLSGAPREAFEHFGLPRATPLFGPTFHGEATIVSADVLQDPRYGKMGPHHGMPKGHLPVRSYLAVPVKSRNGEVIGGLFFGHPEQGVFTARTARLIEGVAAQTAIAIDNARLYEAAQKEIDERKKVAEQLEAAKEQLRRHAEELESEVAARTSSLTEALAQLEEFSYSVSHDLRAPVRAIAGYTDLLKKDFGPALPEGSKGYLDKIARGAARMERLVTDVLAVSRLTRSDIKLVPIQLGSFIQQIVETNPAMQAPAVDLTIDAPHSALADEPSLGQALSNLLFNAVKFVSEGAKPIVHIRSEDKGDFVRISVEDQGIGVPERYRSKLFGMFQRLPTEATYEGTGIGLAIVRKAVERMGGKVGMEANQPHGSRFWIELKQA